MMDMTTFIGLDPEAKNEADLNTFESFIDELLVMEDKKQACGHLRQMKATDHVKFIKYMRAGSMKDGFLEVGKFVKLAYRLHDVLRETMWDIDEKYTTPFVNAGADILTTMQESLKQAIAAEKKIEISSK